MLAFAEQGRYRHAQMLAEQIEQCRFERGHGVDGRAQIEGLQAAAARVAVGELRARLVEHRLQIADRLADHERTGIVDGLANALAAGNFAHAGVAGAVAQDDDVAREERAVRAAQVHQHAVAAGDWHDAQFGDDRRGVRRRGM